MPRVYQQLNDYINWCFTITVAISLGLLSRDELINLYQAHTMAAIISI